MSASNSQTSQQMTQVFSDSLRRAGLRPASAEAKAELFSQCLEQFASPQFAEPSDEIYECFVPGRVEVLGKHTDYAGGRSLICAVDLGFNTVVRARRDTIVRIRDVFQGKDLEFDLANLPSAKPHDWTVYPLTVARRVVDNFPGALRGADIAFYSDLPAASGLSSSSAFIIALFQALAAVNNLEEHEQYKANIKSPEDLAGYLATHENGQTFGTLVGEKGVGTFGGSEDHTAILCSQAGRLVQYHYCPVAFERSVRVPEGLSFLIGVSGVVADKNSPITQELYNRKSRLAFRLAQLWREATGRAEPHLGAIIHSGPGAAEELLAIVRRSATEPYSHEELINRFKQFEEENEQIVPGAGSALHAGDLKAFGELVDRSQQLAETWLGTQVPETIFLARAARELGAHAASSFGAGFGGAVWALVNTADLYDFEREWAARYRTAFPEAAGRSAWRSCNPGPAAFALPIKF